MNPLYKNVNYSSQDRLNDILDKISHLGRKSLSELELDFLDSYALYEEEEMNDILSEVENDTIFESDDDLFTFKLDEIHRYSDQIHLIGTITVPDISMKGKIIPGILFGKIIIFSKSQFGVDFSDDKYDIFEFISGLEYEFDTFVDDIIKKINF